MRAISRLTVGEAVHDIQTEIPGLYFFQVFTNGVRLHASDGLLFVNKRLAWQEAAESTCQIIRDMYGRIEPGLDWRMDVSDDTGKVVYQFSFRAEDLDNSN